MEPLPLRSRPTSELIELYVSNEAKPQHKLVIIDELHQRGEQIPCTKGEFNAILAALGSKLKGEILSRSREFSLAVIYEFDQTFRGNERLEWHLVRKDDQKGRVSLNDLVRIIHDEQTDDVFVWNRYMADWIPLSSYDHWKGDHQLVFKVPRVDPKPEVQTEARQPTSSGFPLVMGVLTIVSFPFWLVFFIVALISGFGSFIGPLLPAVFSIFMFLMSIPMAIGLLRRKRWAWGMLVMTTIFGLVWFGGTVVFEGPSLFWAFLAIVELIILTLALTAKESFA